MVVDWFGHVQYGYMNWPHLVLLLGLQGSGMLFQLLSEKKVLFLLISMRKIIACRDASYICVLRTNMEYLIVVCSLKVLNF